jgi:hypothetical protein
MERPHRFAVVDGAPEPADRPGAEADDRHIDAGPAEASVSHRKKTSGFVLQKP